MSVRSSALRSLSSAMTAPTNPSVRSSVIGGKSHLGGISSSASRAGGVSTAGHLAPLKQDLQWIRYKRKNEQQARDREFLRKSQSVNQSPPGFGGADAKSNMSSSAKRSVDERLQKFVLNPKATGVPMRVHTNAPTTIPDLQSPPNVFAGAQDQLSQKSDQNTSAPQPSTVPYPFMSGFLDRKMGNRFNKKVVFDRSDYDDLLGQIID